MDATWEGASMWVMIVTFLFYSSVDRGDFSPTVESIEFSSKPACEAASAAYLGELKPVADELNADIVSKREVGEWRGPGGVVISAVCVAK
jgi:hypothetical protein